MRSDQKTCIIIIMGFTEGCNLHRILVAIYQPYLTHLLQSLDVYMSNFWFTPIWKHSAIKYMKSKPKQAIDVGFPLVLKFFVYPKTFAIKNIIRAWQMYGLLLFNPEQVMNQIRPQDLVSRPNSIDLSHSRALLSSSWPQVNCLLKTGIGNSLGLKFRMVANTQEHLAAENNIPRAEIQGLKRQVIDEKRR